MLKDIIEGYKSASELVSMYENWDKKGLIGLYARFHPITGDMLKESAKISELERKKEKSSYARLGAVLYAIRHPYNAHKKPDLIERVTGKKQ